MNFTECLNYDEKAIFSLRSLYSKYGYTQYKMSKFEEYDLYVRNKDFLISDNVITFTDTNGRLMALKPDVTLSIIKNSKDISGYVQKLYYNENVYRVSTGTNSFKEIMQAGLECIGDIDDYCITEVLSLAAQSLKSISEDFVLDVSNIDVLSCVIDELTDSAELKKELIKCAGEKNAHEIGVICSNNGIEESKAELLKQLVMLYGSPAKVLPKLKKLVNGSSAQGSVEYLEKILSAFQGDAIAQRIRIDFSVISDVKYYNGIVFKGFINSIPDSVLSGGQYDSLMKKMNRRSKAIGFAVYLDMLERFETENKEFDVDVLLLYNKDDDISAVKAAAEKIIENGSSVSVVLNVPEKLKYRSIVKFGEEN